MHIDVWVMLFEKREIDMAGEGFLKHKRRIGELL